MTTIVGYIRVSSDGQLEGDGPERQETAIREFCKTHTLPLSWVCTESISGTSEGANRPVFSDVLNQSGNLVIVVEKLDRLARDLMVSELLLRECRKRGVKVYAADQGALIDMTGGPSPDPTRTFIRQVLGAVAEFEKSALVCKLREARQRAAKRGIKEGAKPYGKLPGEANIKRLATDFRNQGQSLPAIAALLNNGGFTTRFRRPWTKSTVYNITTS